MSNPWARIVDWCVWYLALQPFLLVIRAAHWLLEPDLPAKPAADNRAKDPSLLSAERRARLPVPVVWLHDRLAYAWCGYLMPLTRTLLRQPVFLVWYAGWTAARLASLALRIAAAGLDRIPSSIPQSLAYKVRSTDRVLVAVSSFAVWTRLVEHTYELMCYLESELATAQFRLWTNLLGDEEPQRTFAQWCEYALALLFTVALLLRVAVQSMLNEAASHVLGVWYQLTNNANLVDESADPVVFVHGMLGWDSEYNWVMGPYFSGAAGGVGLQNQPVRRTLTAQYTSTMALDESARQLYYCIRGGDYTLPTSRVPIRYPGVYPTWSDRAPIHVAAHSRGCQVALRMHDMMMRGEFGALDHPERWIRHMALYNGPMYGSPFAEACTTPERFRDIFLSRIVVGAVVMMARLNTVMPWTKRLWDARMEHTSLAKRPLFPLPSLREMGGPLYKPLLNVMIDLRKDNSARSHGALRFSKDTQYTVVALHTAYWTVGQWAFPATLDPLVWLISFTRVLNGTHHKHPNDGLVDVDSALGRFVDASHADMASARELPPGHRPHPARILMGRGTHASIMGVLGEAGKQATRLLYAAEATS